MKIQVETLKQVEETAKRRSQVNHRLTTNKQARKPRSYASLKLRPTHLLTYLLTRVKCRATSAAKKQKQNNCDEQKNSPDHK